MSFSLDDFAKALEQHNYEFSKGQLVRGTPFSYESDGILVDIGGKSAAFLPNEEVSMRWIDDITQALPLGEPREFLIIREQNAEGQVALSLRQLEVKQRWEELAEMQDTPKTLRVRVSGVNKGGVTVDLDGLRGFIPRSHLVDRDNLEALVGKALTVTLLEVNQSAKKLVLSQRLASQAASLSQIEVGQLISGKVSSIRPFGVFVDFDGASGLLHINQISKNYVSSLDKLFEVGQPVKAVVVDLDEVKRRVSLSTKVLETYPGEMLDNRDAVMAEADSRMQKLAEQNAAAASKPEPEAEATPEPDATPDAD
ncbi:S1 RNA-binding domain-containing protein [Leptolyngbya sp. AN02str]|uniref:S1 RNA-binding domain-containing protein n=1 Tax=Leptolyngbya sp. AN02str TaxID=3423363 RepID=UPI003D31DFA7